MASIFLSHSSQDNEAAGQLSRRLKEHGYDCLFLDFDPDGGIKAGRDWERELYRNLKLARAVIVLCSASSMASRWCFVEIAQAKALGKPIFPVRISPCPIESILADRQVIDLTAIGIEEACRRLFDGLRVAGLDPADSFHWDSSRPPFPGLNSFDAQDAGIYFGRDSEVRQVIETLTRLERQGEPRLLVVVGSSGSGKSSLIRAGVLPRLRKDPARWALVEPFRPRAEPISELARSLASAFPEGPARPDWKAIRDVLKEESQAANAGGGRARDASSMLTAYASDLTMALGRRDASVLLVVDQAEELLQDASPGDEASAFFTVLRRATERAGGRVFGLLTLRSDFLGSFQNHGALRGIAFADLPLGLLPVENFPQVIEGPADRALIGLEPGLVRSMIADARTDDALPLLAFTLREMYERCPDQERFTLKVYRDDLGGIKGAVARTVERIKTDGKWTPEVGRALRRAFLKLVRVNDDGQFTRQPCRWADLPDLAAPVLEAFVKARLLSSNGDVLEVTHESLYRVWPELAGWLDESRELMLWRKNLNFELDDWITHERSPLYLLSGARVAEGRRWLASNADDLGSAESEFITASIAAEDERIARERSQQQKLRRLAQLLAVAAVVAALIGFYAFSQRNEAIAKRRAAEEATSQAKALARIATSRQLAALSVAERDKRFDRSLLLAVAALQTETTLEARNSLFNALQDRPGLTSFLNMKEGELSSVSVSPDGKTIAAGYRGNGGNGGVVLWIWNAVIRKHLVGGPLLVKEGVVSSVSVSPDGKTIAAGYASPSKGGVVLWDLAARKRVVDEPLAVNEGEVSTVAFSPDGETIAAGYRHGRRGGVILWALAARKRLAEEPLPVREGEVLSVAFSPDGKTIAAGYASVLTVGGVVLWDVTSRQRQRDVPLIVKGAYVWSVDFSRDGKTIAAGYQFGSSGGVVLWDLAARKRLLDEPLPLKAGPVWSVSFSPDSKTIAAGYGDGTSGGVVLCDLATRQRLVDEPLSMKEGWVRSVSFSPDGKSIAAGYIAGDDNGVMLWDLTPRNRLFGEPLAVKGGNVRSVAFSPDGKLIVAGHDGAECGGLVFWDVAAHKRLFDEPLPLKMGGVLTVAFSPAGKTIAAGYWREEGGGGVVLLDVAARKRLFDEPLPVKDATVRSVAFSPDGKTMAAGFSAKNAEGGLMLWDAVVLTGLLGEPLPVNEGEVRSVAFSPDGKTMAAGYSAKNAEGGVALWDAAARKRLVGGPLPVNEGEVWDVAFSPDGKTIAAGCTAPSFAPQGMVLWDLPTRKRLTGEPLSLEGGYAWSVAFSPDARTIAAGYNVESGGGVLLWEVASRKTLGDERLFLQDRHVSSVSFSPDGKTIAAGYYGSGGDGGVVLWDIDLESWQRRAGRIANRNFTREEWRDYLPDTPYRAIFPDLPVPPEVAPK